MPDTTPMVTFGMPVYNEAAFLEEALECIVKQTRTDWVLHISDNASDDETEAICRRFAEEDARIRYERFETNRGAGFNWSNVLEQAETPLFAWAGGHDRWAPRFLEALIPLHDNPELVLAYPRTIALDRDGHTGDVYQDDHTNTAYHAPADRFLRLVKHLGVSGNMLHGLWRTKALQSVPIRDSFAPDTLLITELALLGYYEQHPDVLFYRRLMRAPETCRERVTRAWTDVTARSVAPPWMRAHARFIAQHLEILAEQDSVLTPALRTKVQAQTTITLARRFLLMPWLREEVVPRLPSHVANGLRSLWRLRP